MRVVAIILAGGEGSRLTVLSEHRAKPSVPFAGKYRIIDFTISNCVNSQIYDVAVLTQYRPHSLNEHIGIGKPWDLDRIHGGIRLLQPYRARGEQGWYEGTADAVYQNINLIRDTAPDQVAVFGGDHIYKFAVDQMEDEHRQNRADLTVAVFPVPEHEASEYGVIEIDQADPGEDVAVLGRFLDAGNGLIAEEDVEAFAGDLPAGSSAVALAFEHTWFKPLRDEIVESGGILLADVRIPGIVVDEVLDAVATLEDE